MVGFEKTTLHFAVATRWVGILEDMLTMSADPESERWVNFGFSGKAPSADVVILIELVVSSCTSLREVSCREIVENRPGWDCVLKVGRIAACRKGRFNDDDRRLVDNDGSLAGLWKRRGREARTEYVLPPVLGLACFWESTDITT